MKSFLFYIVFTLVSLSGYSNDIENIFDTKNINRVVNINGSEYYELDFEYNIYADMELNDVTFNLYVYETIKAIYKVDINKDSVLCIVGYSEKSDTVLLKPYLDGTIKSWNQVRAEIFIPKKVNHSIKTRYNTYINTSIPSNVFKSSSSYINEIDSLNGSSEEVYTKFLKLKAIEFYNSYDKIEDVIFHTSLYITTIVSYDLDYLSTQFNIKEVLDSRNGVCAGYTEIFSIMIDTIARVDSSITMHSQMTTDLPEGLHICNLIEINGYLYLNDITNISNAYDTKSGNYFTNSNYDNNFLRKRLNYYGSIVKHDVKYDSDLDFCQYSKMKFTFDSTSEELKICWECDSHYINFSSDENIQKYIVDRMLPMSQF
jgi:hypothetical protein